MMALTAATTTLLLLLYRLNVMLIQTESFSVEHRSRGKLHQQYYPTRRWRTLSPASARVSPPQPRYAKKNEDDEDEASRKPGMEEAFRQLEALQSLGDDDRTRGSSDVDVPPPKKIRVDDALPKDAAAAAPVSPEQEIAVYKDMVGELEQNEEAAAYTEMLSELGGKPKQVDGDTYSDVLTDLGGTPPILKKEDKESKKEEQEVNPPTTLSSDDDSNLSTEEFMDSALQEALKEVKVHNPRILGTDAKSILDNKEIMKEIEGIFEQGNEKLLASLEEIRLEQQQLAQAQAAAKAKNAEATVQDDAQRLVAAERSMQSQLDKVAQETAEVERAVADLRAAQEELNNDFGSKLRAGGLPKQGALAGLLLFGVRSILDSITAVSTGDPAALTTALAQGVIAVVCAIVFFFL